MYLFCTNCHFTNTVPFQLLSFVPVDILGGATASSLSKDTRKHSSSGTVPRRPNQSEPCPFFVPSCLRERSKWHHCFRPQASLVEETPCLFIQRRICCATHALNTPNRYGTSTTANHWMSHVVLDVTLCVDCLSWVPSASFLPVHLSLPQLDLSTKSWHFRAKELQNRNQHSS